MKALTAESYWGNKVQVVILCGGLGTRLRSVLPQGLPKSMAVVGEEPFIKKLILHLYSQGARRFILALGYQAHIIKNYIESTVWPHDDIEIKYSIEGDALGTAGALVNCIDQINTEDIFVLNGDTFAKLDYEEMLYKHVDKGSKITMALAKVSDVGRYGLVKLSRQNEIISFEEKSNIHRGSGLINAGIYILKGHLLRLWPAKRPLSMEKDVIPGYIANGLAVFLSDVYFIDIGTPESYAGANNFIQTTLKA